MYTAAQRRRRMCTARRKDGEKCQAYACWDDAKQRCVSHAGRHHRGHTPRIENRLLKLILKFNSRKERRTRYVPCTCGAFSYPHRPTSGACRWPKSQQPRIGGC